MGPTPSTSRSGCFTARCFSYLPPTDVAHPAPIIGIRAHFFTPPTLPSVGIFLSRKPLSLALSKYLGASQLTPFRNRFRLRELVLRRKRIIGEEISSQFANTSPRAPCVACQCSNPFALTCFAIHNVVFRRMYFPSYSVLPFF